MHRQSDEVSESCIAFNAISVEKFTEKKRKIFIILRQNAGDQYRSSEAIITLNYNIRGSAPYLSEEESIATTVDSIDQLKRLYSEQVRK
jgi:hypothetical protein